MNCNSINRCRPLLGTYLEISLRGDFNDNELLESSEVILSRIQEVHDCMGYHDSESELSLINRHASQQRVKISHAMQEVFQICDQIHKISNGDFDPTIASILVHKDKLPNHGYEHHPQASWKDVEINQNEVYFNKGLSIDLGGIAKGYAVDQAFKVLPKEINLTVNAGGDIRSSLWKEEIIGIRVPNNTEKKILPIHMLAASMATSAGYFHDDEVMIFDPQGKKLSDPKLSATVFAPSCVLADALTKIMFLNSNFEDILEFFNATGFFVDQHGEIL